MADVPNIPAAPAAPAVPATPVAPTNAASAAPKAPAVDAKAAVEAKLAAANEKPGTAPDSLKGANAAEQKVIEKIKVGDMTYDEPTLKRMIEKSDGADKKFLEAAQMRKEAIRFMKLAKENPKEFLAKLGLDPKKFAYDEVAQDVKNKLRDPKEVALEQAEAKLKEYEAKEAAAKEQAKKERLEKQAKAAEAKIHQDIIEALESAPSLPKNAATVAKMAKYMQTVLDKTGVMLSPKEIVKTLERDIRGELGTTLKDATAEQLVELLGEDALAKLRAYDMNRLKDPLKQGTNGQATPDAAKPQKKWKNSKEYWKSIDQAAKAEREARGQ